MAYTKLYRLLDSLLSFPVSSTSSTFTQSTSSITSLVYATTTTSSSTLPPISSLTVVFSPVQCSSSSIPPLPLLLKAHLQQFSAVRQFTNDLQQRTPRHPKRPQLPPGDAGSPIQRSVHTAVYKQELSRYNKELKIYENYIDEFLSKQTAELD